MKEWPKILIVTNSYPNRYKPYAGKYVERHLTLHREYGLDGTVLTPNDSRRGFFRSIWKYLKLSIRAFWILLFTDFALLHAHWELPSGLIGAVLAGVRRTPFLLTSHGAFTDSFERYSLLTRKLVRIVLRRADMVVAVGQEQRYKVQAIADLPDRRVVSINMGVWLPQIPLNRSEARRYLNLAADERSIIFIGNLRWRKGADILVRAAAILKQSGYSFRLIVGGQGPEAANLHKLIQILDLAEVTTLIGAVLPDDVFTWFAAADVCVVPSRTEPFGLVAIEAMACSTAVVAANVGGLRETIVHGENGFLFPVEDHVALARQLQQILDDDNLREQVVEKGRKTAVAYDMRLQAAKVRDIYLQLIGNQCNQVSENQE